MTLHILPALVYVPGWAGEFTNGIEVRENQRDGSTSEVDILVNVGLIPIDQLVSVTLSAVQQGAELFNESCPPFGVGTTQQLFGFLPRQVQPVQGRADGFAAAQAAEPRLHEADQPLQRPAGFRVGTGDGRRGCFLLGCPNFCAECGCDVRAKGGRPPVRRYSSALGPCSL